MKGNPLNSASETSIIAGITYTTPLEIGGRITLRADTAYRSRVYFREFKAREDSQDPYTVVAVNAIWENSDASLSVRLFARNLTNEKYITYINATDTGGGRFGSWGMPRQVGCELTRNFGTR